MSFLNRKLLSAEVNFEVPLFFNTLWTISADNIFDDTFLVFRERERERVHYRTYMRRTMV